MNEQESSMDWDEFWRHGVTPGEYFDKKGAAPALLDELAKDWMPHGTGSALVPGMGRGYDVEALTRSGRYAHVLGVDISETAVETARSYLDGCELRNVWEVRCGDFFRFENTTRFDLVIDYTFLCALPLAMRERWAVRMRDLIVPGGSLITLMYPLGKSEDEGGPPFGVSFKLFHELLDTRGFQAVDGPSMLPDEKCQEGRQGRSGFARWLRVE